MTKGGPGIMVSLDISLINMMVVISANEQLKSMQTWSSLKPVKHSVDRLQDPFHHY
jgi:hypothetical protein